MTKLIRDSLQKWLVKLLLMLHLFIKKNQYINVVPANYEIKNKYKLILAIHSNQSIWGYRYYL